MTLSREKSSVAVVRTGADRLLCDAKELVRNKRVGIITNHTGRLFDGRHIVDAVATSGLATLAALYGPEHGIAGNTPDGRGVEHGKHPAYNVPIYSLYGKTHKPTSEMLEGVDLLLCDIQDVGARFYTFVSTIALAIEAAAENGIPFIVLDRPNPIRGLSFDGPVRELPLKSFVGWMPMPVTHGMTIGELATMWNEEGQLAGGVKARLQVVKMEGWNREMWFDETGLPWIPPSPNMTSLTTAVIYPGLCFVEGTSLSEGRGTISPFELIGAPWADPDAILRHVDKACTAGVDLAPDEFVPVEIPGRASEPKFAGVRCRGIRIVVRNRNAVEPVKLGIGILSAFKRAHPKETELRHRRFDILTGSPSVRNQLDAGVDPIEICASWKAGLDRFGEMRRKYLLYSPVE